MGKACRPIPVIILSALIARKYHSVWKWIVVILITAGISIFIYDEDKNAQHVTEHADIEQRLLYFGDALLFSSLIFDGLTSAFQEKIRAKSKASGASETFMPLEMMSTLNAWASVIALPFCVFSGEAVRAVRFMTLHPEVIWRIGLMCGCSALGQMCIFVSVCQFGTLTTSIITTLRKFFTILGTVVIFHDKMDFQKVNIT